MMVLNGVIIETLVPAAPAESLQFLEQRLCIESRRHVRGDLVKAAQPFAGFGGGQFAGRHGRRNQAAGRLS